MPSRISKYPEPRFHSREAERINCGQVQIGETRRHARRRTHSIHGTPEKAAEVVVAFLNQQAI